MREIKFRGKNPDGYWIEGDLIHKALTVQSMIVDCGIVEDGCYPIEVIPETVGEFTGLKDKNGKEIYEGDIIKSDKWCFYHLKGGEFNIRSVAFMDGAFSVEGHNLLMLIKDFDGEIIGNIHENPELLEVSE